MAEARGPSAVQWLSTVDVLSIMLSFAAPADSVLSRWLRDRPKLGSQDRAVIAETAFGVLRRLRSLQYLGADSPRRLVLAYWLRYRGLRLDALETMAGEDKDWLAGLRGIDSQSWPPAVQCEWPDWLWQSLEPTAPLATLLEQARALNNAAALDIRVNSFKAKREVVLQQLQAEGLNAQATPYSPLGIRLAEKIALQTHPLFVNGTVEVQDEGSQLLALLVAPRRGEMVVDFCAGAGGKTLLLGALMASSGRLYAFDVSDKRLANLKPRLKRSGLSNVHPVLIAHENDSKVKRLAGKIDRVLVDAPCSGLGTLRRNPDLKWRQSATSVAELVAKQRVILDSAARLLKPGGRLVYATCSLLPEENIEQAQAFLQAHPEFKLLPVAAELARQGVALDTGDYLQLNPAQHGTDGFFAALFERIAV